MNELGERVRAARERRGMTQSDLARATGLSPGAVSRIEHGARVPGAGTVSRLAQSLGVEVGSLLDGSRQLVASAMSSVLGHDGETLEAIRLIARDMPGLPLAGRKRILLIIKAALLPTVLEVVS